MCCQLRRRAKQSDATTVALGTQIAAHRSSTSDLAPTLCAATIPPAFNYGKSLTHAPQDIGLQASVAEFAAAPPLRTLRDRIERLNVSADAKALLMDIAAVTLKVGEKVLAFGRKVLDFVFNLAVRFQNVGFGVILALALSAVLASIPLLGPLIAALLTPIMLAFGIVRGALQDFKDASLRGELDALERRMAIMSAHAAL